MHGLGSSESGFAKSKECLLRVGSRRWVVTDGFHRLSGGKRPEAANQLVTTAMHSIENSKPFGKATIGVERVGGSFGKNSE